MYPRYLRVRQLNSSNQLLLGFNDPTQTSAKYVCACKSKCQNTVMVRKKEKIVATISVQCHVLDALLARSVFQLP